MRWPRSAGSVRAHAACWLVAALATTAQALPGDLDPTFGRGGKLLLRVSRHGNAANALVVQQDGKIVAAGEAAREDGDRPGRLEAVVVRLLPDGTPDASFGVAGKVVIRPRRPEARAVGVALQPDGRIVVAGTTHAVRGRSRFWVGRLMADGTLDRSFGGNGVVTTGFEGGHAQAAALLVTRDGKIVVAGGSYSYGPNPPEIAVARYLPDGRLDPTFARRGRLRLAGVAVASALAEQADGAVVVALRGGFSAARFLADGSLDPTFGGSGIVVADFGGSQQTASAVAIGSDGRVLVGGEAHPGYPEHSTDFALVRYLADGTPDPTFGDAGKVRTAISRDADWGLAMSLQPGGSILLAGATEAGFPFRGWRFALARYAPDGTPDASFGRNGIVLTGFGEGRHAWVTGVALQGTDRILAVGHAAKIENGKSDFALARYEW